MHTTTQITLLSAAWLGYFALHSLLAARSVKEAVERRWPRWFRGYRLAYNLLALILLLVPLGMMIAWRGAPVIDWQGPAAWVANGLALGAVGLFAWTLRYYDMGEFAGTRQWAEHEETVDGAMEHFTLSPLHRFVRHPWYTLGLVILWTRDMDLMQLVSSLWATAYLVVGSRLEERKLMAFHGAVYRRYRSRVPGLVPLPWRYLTAEQAARLIRRGSLQDRWPRESSANRHEKPR